MSRRLSRTNHGQLIGAIYETCLDPQSWPAVLGDVASELGAVVALLGPRERATLRPLRLWSARLDPTRAPAFYETVNDNPWTRNAGRFPLGQVITSEQITTPEELQRSRFYHGVVCPLHVHHGMGATVSINPELIAHIAFHRGQRRGPFDQSDTERCGEMIEHITRALRIQALLGEQAGQIAALQHIVDRLPLAVALVDATSRVIHLNSSAEALVRGGDGLAVTRGVLRATTRAETSALHALVERASRVWVADDPPAGDALPLSRPSLRRPLSLLVIALPPWLSPLGVQQATAAVLISDPEQQTPSPRDLLRRLYHLTATEAAVTMVILQGRSLRQAAEELGVALSTARTHLQRVFDKTGARRQGDLVRLLLRGPAGQLK